MKGTPFRQSRSVSNARSSKSQMIFGLVYRYSVSNVALARITLMGDWNPAKEAGLMDTPLKFLGFY